MHVEPILLETLPTLVLSKIVSFTTQDDTLELSRTNFKFYEPCSKKLYKRLWIQDNPLQAHRDEHSHRDRGRNFNASAVTVISGFQNVSVAKKYQHKLINSRIQILIQSLLVNRQLIDYIEELTVQGFSVGADVEISTTLGELFQVIRQSLSLTRVCIEDQTVRQVFYGGYGALPRTLRNLNVVGVATGSIDWENCPTVDEMTIDDPRKLLSIPHEKLLLLHNLQVRSRHPRKEQSGNQTTPFHAICNDNVYNVSEAEAATIKQYVKVLPRLTSIGVCFDHSNGDVGGDVDEYVHRAHEIINIINWCKVRSLTIEIGCENVHCNQTCISRILDHISIMLVSGALLKLTHLSFKHLKEFGTWGTHEDDVKWDLAIFGFLATIFKLNQQSTTISLQKLTIVNDGAYNGVYPDGMEGNYLRRVELYTRTLPSLLVSNSIPIKLSLPTLFTTLANYEQPMNNILWNGCKCAHCLEHLPNLDEYLMTHKYYSNSEKCWKDLTTCQLMVAIGDQLSKRFIEGEDFYAKTHWDLHKNRFGLPFLCLQHKTIDEGEFENEDLEFFDAVEELTGECSIAKRTSFSDISICISHYLKDMLLKMLNLNRGNAEGFELGGDFENDGGSSKQIFHEIEINGILFSTGEELNGTNWLDCLLD